MFGLFHFDLISFWLGFVSALFFWWGISQFKGFIPRIGSTIKESIQTTQTRRQGGIEKYLSQNTLIKIQGLHVANQLFSLDEIAIPPRLLIPTYLNSENEEAYAITTIASQVIPYLPDTPELTAQFPVNSLSPVEALQEGANIVVVGEAGAGKTVSLAYTAVQIINQNANNGKLINHLPCYIHIVDLDLESPDKLGPVGLIINHLVSLNSSFVRSRIPDCIIKNAQNGTLLLLLDGLDELPRESFDRAVEFIQALSIQYPRIQFMVTAIPTYLGGLIKMGFTPLTLANWNFHEVESFVQNWNHLWLEYINISAFKDKTSDDLDTRILSNWMIGQHPYMTPFEWTTRVWAAYSGDLNGQLSINAIDNYISKLSNKIIGRTALEYLALEFIRLNVPSLSQTYIDDFYQNYSPNQNKTTLPPHYQDEPAFLAIHHEDPNANPIFTGRPSASLIDSGLLIKHDNGQVRFANPVLTGFLSSFPIAEEQITKIPFPMQWSMTVCLLRYVAAQNRATTWIETNITEKNVVPLHNNIIMSGKWIGDTSVTSNLRTNIMRKILSLVTLEALPFPVKARLMSLFVGSNDTSVSKLVKQFFSTNSEQLKTLAALAAGATLDIKQKRELINLLSDPSQTVRNAAALSIGALATQFDLDAVSDMLMNGDDQVRQCAAEAFAQLPGPGYDLLKEAITMDDLMVRKAAVFGLIQVNEPWAVKLLEKTSIEDKQWVVRNAAHQAFELSQRPNPFIPKPLAAPSEAPWLIQFASKKSVGVQPGLFPRQLLLDCLTEGTLDEKIDSLSYLVRYPDADILYAIIKLVNSSDRTLVEAATNALWQISVSGFSLNE